MSRTFSLDGEWQLWHCKNGQGRPDEVQGISWIKATVPGCAHYDLLVAGHIEDPFFEFNTKKLYELEGHEWWYRREFRVPPDFVGEHVELVCEGLDTFATVWLNGKEVGRHSNMFTPCRFDVTGALQPGKRNELVVRLASPIESVKGLPLDGAHATMNTPERLWARKIDQCYGWDIAPRIVTAGIWRSLRLEAFERARISDDFLRVTAITPSPANPLAENGTRASVRHDVSVEIISGSAEGLRVEVSGVCGDSEFRWEAPLDGDECAASFDVENARLWWTWDIGNPDLYDLTVSLFDGDKLLDRRHRKQGLRTVRLVEEEEGPGRVSYVFELNGVKVFARGMNWTPADCYHARAEGAKHRELLDMVRRMNLNMLRVWGGGVYEPHAWFQQLDELGIMVYQDFMMSCAIYPTHPDFLAIMAEEAEAVIRGLRNYACLALWSGDNENDCAYWGWFGENIDVRKNTIVRQVLPDAIERFDGTRDYVPSSPYSPDPTVNPQDQNQGDTHCWHHGTPFEDPVYTQDKSRFISEIGHLSCPALETMMVFASPTNLWPNDNAVWDHHIGVHEDLDFRPPRRKALDDSVIAYFGEMPSDLETYILASQICQGEAYKLWTEHCRQRKANWDCGGILLWNVADCWPQISDAVIDYYLRPKLACNYVRWACEPVHASFMHGDGGELLLHVANDTAQELELTYSVSLEETPGIVAQSIEGRCSAPANSAQVICDVSELAGQRASDGAVLTVQLRSADRLVSWNRHAFEKPTLADIPRIIAGLPGF
ncbi:MAG: hypothetical protein HPY44_14810 [Armatimonadetes bacterium]|nr:hypothetical protein [Armatimonadota bacterium]